MPILLRTLGPMLALLALGTLLGGSVWGCDGSDHHDHSASSASATQDTPTETTTGLYRVRLRPEQEPIPMNAIHNWVAHVETAAGQAIDTPELRFDGGMPQHGHGFVTSPRVTRRLGPKEHLIEGVKFHMAGDWVLQLDIRADEGTDTIRIPIRVDP